MSGTGDVTVGIKTFMRVKELEACLASVCALGTSFAEVLVADDGEPSSEKDELFRAFAARLPLKVLALPYDSGLGFGRNRIVDACRTPYLLLLDDDQTVPANVMDARRVLEADPEIGGVSGFLMESGERRCNATNLATSRGYVVRDLGRRRDRRHASELTYLVFDFIPNATLYRIECLRASGWDDDLKIGFEHLDFFLAHKRLAVWRFGILTSLLFGHDRGSGGRRYLAEYRTNAARLGRSRAHFFEKWRLRGVLKGWSLTSRKGVRSGVVHYLHAAGVPPHVIARVDGAGWSKLERGLERVWARHPMERIERS